MRPEGTHQALHWQPGDACLAELVGEYAGSSRDHGNVMAKAAQLKRELAHMTLGSAQNITPGEHMNDFHARPLRSFSAASSDPGRKVSLDGRPYQVASKFHSVRHSASSAAEGACAAW